MRYIFALFLLFTVLKSHSQFAGTPAIGFWNKPKINPFKTFGFGYGAYSVGYYGESTSTGNNTTPQGVLSGYEFTAVSVAAVHACGLQSSGQAWCWGGDSDGQLGDGAGTPSAPTPAQVSGGHNFQKVSVGYFHTCGLDTAGAAWCWGDDQYGKLGNSTPEQNMNTPQAVDGSHVFSDITAGSFHNCGLKANGEAWCWGTQYATGDNDTSGSGRFSPVQVVGGHNFFTIDAGYDSTCAINQTGQAWCWGNGSYGALGDGNTGNHYSPVAVAGGHTFVQISSGYQHSCAITQDGTPYCWGRDNQGQLGNGAAETGNKTSPFLVSGGHKFVKIDAGANTDFPNTCGLKANGELWCWGRDRYGQNGNGDTTKDEEPVLVHGGYTFSDFEANTTTMAITGTPPSLPTLP